MRERALNRPLALVVAGGTGGHLYPGIALARALRAAHPPWEVLFVVRRGDLGREALQREGFGVQEISGQGLPRAMNARVFTFPFRFLAGCRQAWAVVRRRRPRAVIGMGGYLSFPVLLAAHWQRIPTFIHEQNVLPGLANRILGRWANAVAVSFPDSARHFRARRIWVSGLPVRREIGRVSPAEGRKAFGLDAERLTVLIFGGSQGAHRMNETLLEAWKRLAWQFNRFQVLHVAGPRDQAAIEAAYRSLPVKAVVLGYCHDMPSAYAAADLVICRAGASTVAELLAAERPSILIPFPYASGNHQLYNAKVLEADGLGEILPEKDLNPERLGDRLQALLSQPDLLKSWQSRFAKVSLKNRPNGAAAARLAQFIMEAVSSS